MEPFDLDKLMGELSIKPKTELELAIEELNVLEGTIVEDNENLTILDKERKIVEEQLQAIMRKMREIETKRFDNRGKVRKARIKVEVEEHKEAERVREAALQEQRTATFENLREYAKDLNPAWYRYAMRHQWEAAMQIAIHGSVLLADGMGLGKTLTSIMSADLLKAKKVLVITPSDVSLNFFDEFRMWAPHRNSVPMKSATPQVKAFMGPVIQNSEEITLVMNYETLWGRGQSNADFLQILIDAKFDVMYVDEFHNAKNTKGLTFDFLTKLRKTVKQVIPISGTFILNEPQDIWPALNLIDPRAFDSQRLFLETYCKRNMWNNKWEFKSGGEKSLVTMLGGRIIRRTFAELAKDDPKLQLPPQHINEVLIPMARVSDEQLSIMHQLNNYSQILLNKTNEDGSPKSMSVTAQIALITRQRQCAVYPGGIKIIEYDEDENGKRITSSGRVVFDVSEETKASIKIDVAVERITDMHSKGHRTVVFSQFKTGIAELALRLREKGLKVARFDGDTPDPERQKIKKDFLRASDGHKREKFDYDVVIANFKTGGVGLTFTEATYMLLLDEEWNPGKNEQAYARINRIGQTQENYVDILRLENSIDMWMKSLNELKKSISDGFEGEVDMQASLNNYFANGSTEVIIAEPKIIIEGDLELETQP
jgi:SNF2 family DNA or RNA helicase